jgi:acyloxyacyl hydrolase
MGNTFCKYFPSGLTATCHKFATLVGPFLIEDAAEKYNADFVCRKVGACTGVYTQCSIEGPSPPNPTSPSPLEHFIGELKGTNPPKFVAPWNWLVQLYKSFDEDHLPIVDLDQDGFSTQPQFRGYNWRGKDCNDLLKGVRPGVDKYDGN